MHQEFITKCRLISLSLFQGKFLMMKLILVMKKKLRRTRKFISILSKRSLHCTIRTSTNGWCLFSDIVSVNLSIARLCNKPHIGCASHKLNLEKNVISNDVHLNYILDSVHSTIFAAKGKSKNSAILNRFKTNTG